MSVFIECDKTDSERRESEGGGSDITILYGFSDAYDAHAGVLTSRVFERDGLLYSDDTFYGTCRSVFEHSAGEPKPTLSDSTYAYIECQGEPDPAFYDCTFEDPEPEVDLRVDIEAYYDEFGTNSLDISIRAGRCTTRVEFRDCKATGSMVEELRASRESTPRPELTKAATERAARLDCSTRASEDAERTYGEDAHLNSQTARFNEFYKDVIVVGLQYGRDETASTGAGFEDLYHSLLGESAYVSERRREAWEYRDKVFDQCLEAQSIAPYREPELDATTRCVGEGVAEVWKKYGDDALDYTDEVSFIFDELALWADVELSIGEAWSIADDYWQDVGRSPFNNPEAFELATSRNCEPWQGEGTGMPIAEP